MGKAKLDRRFIDFGDKDFYKFYKDTSKDPVSYKDYKKIIGIYNRKIVHILLNGKIFYFGEGLSYIKLKEIRRSLRLDKKGNPILPINWSETKKQNLRDDEGKLIRIYITDQPFYYKTTWYNCKGDSLQNAFSFYKFFPAKEFRLTIAKNIRENPFIVNNFRNFRKIN